MVLAIPLAPTTPDLPICAAPSTHAAPVMGVATIVVIDPFVPTAAQQDAISGEDYAALAAITLALLLLIQSRTTMPIEAELESYITGVDAELEREMTLPTEALLNADGV